MPPKHPQPLDWEPGDSARTMERDRDDRGETVSLAQYN